MVESVNDKYIFKAVFLAGGPGSGKSFITDKVFGYDGEVATSPLGAKIVNSDYLFEKFLKKYNLPMIIDPSNKTVYDMQMTVRNSAKALTSTLQGNWMNSMLPLIIDGTGRDAEKMLYAKQELEMFGYDTAMIFVNTSLEVALERNQQRPRKVDKELVVEFWHDVQNNMGLFQREFGNSDFYVVDNNETLSDKELKDFELKLFKMGEKMITQPLDNYRGIEIIKKLRSVGGKYITDLGELEESYELEGIELLEGQELYDIDGNKYLIEKGDMLMEDELHYSDYHRLSLEEHGWTQSKNEDAFVKTFKSGLTSGELNPTGKVIVDLSFDSTSRWIDVSIGFAGADWDGRNYIEKSDELVMDIEKEITLYLKGKKTRFHVSGS